MSDTAHEAPDWENFAKAVLTDWPTGDLDGSVLFDLSLQYGMIKEVPGGYNSDHHIDADCICPEEGDPWYEYTFRGEAGPGLYSITDMNKRIEELEANGLANRVAILRLASNVANLEAERDALADRIEELEKACAEWAEVSQSNYQRAKAAEAKLTKAVEALLNLADCVDLGCYCSEMQMAAAMDEARATIAELKGQGDE